ncbi:hypothetical protein ACFHW2_14455 [Actinomadura sp. LOL_016]|uniref:hypothetical protein n=1 Tax=unclassified Actinomadura TaxID=2626254 RepID=UPI003A7FD058
MADTLEDAVEYVEARVVEAELRLIPDITPILWMATPAADADVVHQALNSRPAASTTGLFKGPWPYGPTHMIEEDGPRPRPRHPVHLLSPQQALARLHAGVPGPRQ